MGYSVKYGVYPHNVPLQMLCETGLLGSIPFMLLILLAAIQLLRTGWTNRSIRYLFLFFIAYAISANISGDLWYCSALLCALGYSLTLPSINASTKPDEQTS